MKYIIFALFFLAALVSLVSGQACVLCGGSFTPTLYQPASSAPQPNEPAVTSWGKANGAVNAGCYWCDAGTYVPAIGWNSCTLIIGSIITSCASGCVYSNLTTSPILFPGATSKATCEGLNFGAFAWSFITINNFRCSCGNQGRDTQSHDNFVMRQSGSSTTAGSTYMSTSTSSPSGSSTGAQYCVTSPQCSTLGQLNCSNCTNCPNVTEYPCSFIQSGIVSQYCPGYPNSSYSSQNCPNNVSPTPCALCGLACNGTVSQFCHFNSSIYPCTKCHNAVMKDNSTRCIAHVTNITSHCICSMTGAGACGGSRQDGAILGRTGSPSQGTCAPWGSDVVTVDCIQGQGNNCTVATPADCLAGTAIPPVYTNVNTGYCAGKKQCGGGPCYSIVTNAATTTTATSFTSSTTITTGG